MEVSERARITLTGCAIFAVTVVRCWRADVNTHESLYFLGSRRLADPSFLAADFTWSQLSPTTFLHDHMLAPLWSSCSEITIANIGRFVSWALLAWSIALLARRLRLPSVAVVAGFTLWLLWGQTLAICGSPIEGFQVKSLSYPLLFFALAFVLRDQVVRAGLAAGLATAIHVLVGGWGCLAIFLSMLADRRRFPPRRLAAFLLAAAPFVLPVVLAVGLFHVGHVSHQERVRMDEIYVTLAGPHCCDPSQFMDARTWLRAGIVFLCAPLLIFGWKNDGAKVLGAFVVLLILFFFLGTSALTFHAYGVLKLLPGQLAKSLPVLFLFVFLLARIGKGVPERLSGRLLLLLVLAGAGWLAYDRRMLQTLVNTPRRFIGEIEAPTWDGPPEKRAVYGWIRVHTPRDSIFVTPHLMDFWSYAERAQVATLRQSPLDRRLLEWKERLETLKGATPFRTRDALAEFNQGEGRLTVTQLLQIRTRYGATYYLVDGVRRDLASHLAYSADGYSVYDLAALPNADP